LPAACGNSDSKAKWQFRPSIALAEAYKKVIDGRELTSREQTALKRFEKEKEERLRWQYYAAIPQKHWREMSGRQTKVINEQALRYDIPFGGATVNLPAVVRALHDFLAENALKLNRDDDELLQGNGSPALERYREERALLARLDRQEREGQLLPREVTRIALGRVANILREAGDTLNRQYGAAAGEILSEAIEDAMREIDSTFGPMPDTPQEPEVPNGDPDQQPDGPGEASGAG
jgi:hypothetical protein